VNDYERMQQRHHDGMCGGGCPECYRDRIYEDEQRREREQPSIEEMCDPHPYHGDDADGGRCYCGTKRYPARGGVSLVRDLDQ